MRPCHIRSIYNTHAFAASGGLLGIFELVPVAALSMVGGLIADHGDRRKVLLTTEVIFAVLPSLLLVNALLLREPRLSVIFVLAATRLVCSPYKDPRSREERPKDSSSARVGYTRQCHVESGDIQYGIKYVESACGAPTGRLGGGYGRPGRLRADRPVVLFDGACRLGRR
jgi:hypothetical protein